MVKVKISGFGLLENTDVEIDGNSNEVAEIISKLTQGNNVKKEKVVEKVVENKDVKKSYKKKTYNIKKDWLKRDWVEKAVIMYNKGMVANVIFKKVGVKNHGQTYEILKQAVENSGGVWRGNRQSIKKAPTKVIINSTQSTVARDRMRFINTRAKYLCTQDVRLSYQDARGRAIEEWNNNRHKGVVKSSEELNSDSDENKNRPRIVNRQITDNIYPLLKNLVLNGSKLTLGVDGKMIGIDDRRVWENLLYDIVCEQDGIRDYLKVKGLFKLFRDGNNLNLGFIPKG